MTHTFISGEDIKTYECPDCGGKGEVLIGRLYPSGHTECWDPCEFCDSEGYFTEADYLILKLEGSV